MAEHEKPTLRTKIYLNILKKPIFKPFFFIFEKANLIMFHSDLKEKKYKGEGRNENIYYIRRGAGRNDIAGLVGTYYLVGCEVYVAHKMGMIPYVDFERFPCQYSVEREVNGTKNAWEYYFEQPYGTKKRDAYGGKQFVLSGWTLSKSKKRRLYADEWVRFTGRERKSFLEKVMPVKKYLKNEVNEYYENEFSNRDVLGVFLRGTDYMANKPIGHDVQPTVEMAISKIDLFLKKYDIDRIFLVTEDEDIYSKMKERYRNLVFCSDYNFIRFNPKKDKWVKDAFDNDPYERGKNYLIRVMLLARCKYYVGGLASGSRYALDFGDFEDKYVFQLGTY